MFARKREKSGDQGERFSRAWRKEGRNLYRIYGEKAVEAVDGEAKRIEQSCRADAMTCGERLVEADMEMENTEKGLSKMLEEEDVSLEKVIGRARGAVFRMVLACVMVVVSICVIAWSLGAFFYGNHVLLVVVSLGCGLAIFMCVEVFLFFTEKILNSRQFNLFNAVIAAVMVAFFIAGFVQLSKARAVQMAINQTMQSDAEIYEEDMVDIDKLKKQLDELVKRAMIFLFIPFEWMTGIFFYLASRALSRFRPICKTAQRRDKMAAQRQRLISSKAVLEKVDSGGIATHLRNGIESERTRGSMPLMVIMFVIILGVIIVSILLAEDAFGGVFSSSSKEPTYYLIGYDLTGSTEHDQRENERAVRKIINLLEAGDEFQLVNITQDTFSNPEYMIHKKMPSRAGYFDEEVKRARLRLVSEFRRKYEKICRKRPATSIIEGLCMFSQLLQERRGMRKKLILISDMLQFSKDITPVRIASKGRKILGDLKAEGLIPDMSSMDVYVMGASTAGVDAKTWMGVKRFWGNFFKEAGACMKCYSIQRHWPVD